jgi:hypothetical protein
MAIKFKLFTVGVFLGVITSALFVALLSLI